MEGKRKEGKKEDGGERECKTAESFLHSQWAHRVKLVCKESLQKKKKLINTL